MATSPNEYDILSSGTINPKQTNEHVFPEGGCLDFIISYKMLTEIHPRNALAVSMWIL